MNREKRTISDLINEQRPEDDSVIITLLYKPELQPKDVRTIVKNTNKFLSEVEKATYKKITPNDRFYLSLKEPSGIRTLILIKNISPREARSFNIKKCWKKGKIYISEVESA